MRLAGISTQPCPMFAVHLRASPSLHPATKAQPSLRSSIRGEKAPAHSSMTACVETSSGRDRGSTISEEKVSSSTLVIPRTMPRYRAFALNEQTVCSGGSPSMTTTGCSRSSGRKRKTACAGNSFAYRHAYSSPVRFIECLPMLFCFANWHRLRVAEVSERERPSPRLR